MPRLEVTTEAFKAALLELIAAVQADDIEKAEQLVESIVSAYGDLAALVEVDINKMSAPNN